MITVDRRELTSALKRACKITSKNAHNPRQQAIQITVDREGIALRSTNHETALVEILPVLNGGVALASICTTATSFLGVVNSLPEHIREVPLEARSDFLVVGVTKLLATCPIADFPVIPRVPRQVEALVDLGEEFMRHLRYARTAISREAVRFALTGILFDFKHGNLVGCDGKRLHCAHQWKPSRIPSVIIPPSAFDFDVPTRLAIPKASKDGSIDRAFLFIQNGYIAASTIDAVYPNYIAIVRKEHALAVTVDRAELVSVLEQALPMVNERTPSCLLHINERFEVHADNPDTGAMYVNEIAAASDGTELQVTVDPRQLLSLLRTMAAQDVTLAFRKPNEAIHIVADDTEQWALLMPLAQSGHASAPAHSV